jgi:hypothetical protein
MYASLAWRPVAASQLRTKRNSISEPCRDQAGANAELVEVMAWRTVHRAHGAKAHHHFQIIEGVLEAGFEVGVGVALVAVEGAAEQATQDEAGALVQGKVLAQADTQLACPVGDTAGLPLLLGFDEQLGHGQPTRAPFDAGDQGEGIRTLPAIRGFSCSYSMPRRNWPSRDDGLSARAGFIDGPTIPARNAIRKILRTDMVPMAAQAEKVESDQAAIKAAGADGGTAPCPACLHVRCGKGARSPR